MHYFLEYSFETVLLETNKNLGQKHVPKVAKVRNAGKSFPMMILTAGRATTLQRVHLITSYSSFIKINFSAPVTSPLKF
jgi:hypothetical protein